MNIYDIPTPSPELLAFREASESWARANDVSGKMRPGQIGESESFALTELLEQEMYRCRQAVVAKPPVSLEIVAEHAECVAFLVLKYDVDSIRKELLGLHLAVDAFLKVTFNKVVVDKAA